MKRTGGTTFDPADKFKYFLAMSPQFMPVSPAMTTHKLVAVNEINESSMDILKKDCALGTRLFLDSGIFNLTNEHKRKHGCTMDEALSLAPDEIDGFDKLLQKYLWCVEELSPYLWGYIELDQGGQENKRKTRAKLEKMGLAPIPVYHPLNDGYEYFDELAKNYDRICLGNIVQANPSLRKRLLRMVFERRLKYPHLWIHVLGMHPSDQLYAMPMSSCDASTWSSGLRYPSIKVSACGKNVGVLTSGLKYELGNQEEWFKAASLGMSLGTCDAINWKHCVTEQLKLGTVAKLPKPKRVNLNKSQKPLAVEEV